VGVVVMHRFRPLTVFFFVSFAGRDSNGKFYSILQANTPEMFGETTGLAFGPGNLRMYVSFQQVGQILEIRRKDGLPFGGQRLDIKYHGDSTNANPFEYELN
jgi:hypothetical protein